MLIDVTRLIGRRLKHRCVTGVDRVCMAYVERYAAEARAVVRRGRLGVTLSKTDSRPLFSDLLAGESQGFARRMATRGCAALFGRGGARPAAGELLLQVGHAGLESQEYAHWLRRTGVRPVYMVHDLIPITHPEFCRAREAGRHGRRLDTILDTGAGVITNSAATLAELAGYAAERDRKLPPAVIAHLAGARLPGPSSRRPMSGPYFVVLGTIEARKNHLLLLQLWRRMAEKAGQRVPRLVILGRRGWECEGAIDMLDRCLRIDGVVAEYSDCSDAQLATWLHHAQALLFPSFAEGFGLPLVEALTGGTPVIASDLPVFREIAGDVPDYLDPLDLPAWGRAIEDYAVSSSPKRRAQMNRIAGFRAPSWNDHFHRVDILLERILAAAAQSLSQTCHVG